MTIVVEARTGNVLPLLQAACSRRVIAVPTTQVAARRCAGMPACRRLRTRPGEDTLTPAAGCRAWLPTRARRLARMVQHPSVADVSKALWSFASPSQVYLDTLPQLVGLRFGDLALRFADGIVLGLLNRRTGQCQIAPPACTTVSGSGCLSPARPCAAHAAERDTLHPAERCGRLKQQGKKLSRAQPSLWVWPPRWVSMMSSS